MCVTQIQKWLETKNAAEGKSPPPTIPPSTEPTFTLNGAFGGSALPKPNPFADFRGMTLQDVQLRLGHGLSPAEIEQAKVAGVIVRPDVVIQGEKPDSSGFQLRRDQGPRENDLEPNRTYAFDFVSNGKCELAWSLMGGGGGYIETWINRDGQMIPETYQKIIMGPAGQTYFNALGTYRFCVRHDHTAPVRLGVQIV